MPKPKNKRRVSDVHFIVGAVIILAVICGVLTFTLNHRDTPEVPTLAERVSVGAMRYRIEGDKAVRRTDASVTELQSFLEREADKSGCSASRPGYEHVVAYTKDESQVFLRYGCGAADSPMFAVKKDGVWKSLSPTNHFGMFNIPECSYLDANAISAEIAPVCVSDLTKSPSVYSVR